MAEVTAAIGLSGGVDHHDISAAASVQFPDNGAADKSGAPVDERPAALPVGFWFGTCHILERSGGPTIQYPPCASRIDEGGGLVKTEREPEHLRILIRRTSIERRVRQLGRKITADYRGERLHLIGVLKGASIFLSDLIREIG